MTPKPDRINWWLLITDLMLIADMSQSDIGTACDAGKGWVNSLRNGLIGEPLYYRGILLVRTWERRVGDIHGHALSRVLVQDN